MRTTCFLPGLLVLVSIVAETMAEKKTAFAANFEPAWNDAQFRMDSTCDAVYPEEQGDYELGPTADLPWTCGWRTRRFLDAITNKKDTRIVGGAESIANEWPWMVLIGPKYFEPMCGGTLLNDRFVVTAAHCIDVEEYPCDWNIRVGEHNLLSPDVPHADIEAENFWIHPDFDYDSKLNDIAIIKLAEPANFTQDSIGAACLPDNDAAYAPGTTCYAAGWGTTTLNGDRNNALHHVAVDMVDTATCALAYDRDITPGMVCAGGDGGADSCTGDSGGPLMCLYHARWEVAGVTSFSQGCGEAGVPGIYMSTLHYKNWINAVIFNNS